MEPRSCPSRAAAPLKPLTTGCWPSPVCCRALKWPLPGTCRQQPLSEARRGRGLGPSGDAAHGTSSSADEEPRVGPVLALSATSDWPRPGDTAQVAGETEAQRRKVVGLA